MKKQCIGILGLILIISGCKTTVNLVLKTTDNVNHAAIIALKDKNKVTQKELNCGVISAEKSDTILFKLKKDGFFQVKSTIESGNAIIFSSADISLAGGASPFKQEVELKTPAEMLDDSKSLETLTLSLKKIGASTSANPRNIKDGIDNILGSLIVVGKDSLTNNPAILYTIHPDNLGVRKMKLEDIKWQNTNAEGEIYISGSAAKSVNTAMPMIGKFGATFENNRIYNLRWSMTGYGEHLKPEDPNKSPTQMIMKLHFNDLEQIKLLIENKGARVFYVNQVYLLKKAEVYIKDAKRLEKSDKEVASIISGDMAYTFENSEEKQLLYTDQVLNYWGNEYSFTFDKGKVYEANKLNIDYKISYSLYNLNKRESFSADIFK